jgi:hypothetical protein
MGSMNLEKWRKKHSVMEQNLMFQGVVEHFLRNPFWTVTESGGVTEACGTFAGKHYHLGFKNTDPEQQPILVGHLNTAMAQCAAIEGGAPKSGDTHV